MRNGSACIQCFNKFGSCEQDRVAVKDLLPKRLKRELGEDNPNIHRSCNNRHPRTPEQLLDRALLACNRPPLQKPQPTAVRSSTRRKPAYA